MPNPASGIPSYGATALSKPLSAGKVLDGTIRTYWFPSQTRSTAEAEAWIDDGALADEKYVAPTTWPVAGKPLILPKVVLWALPSVRLEVGTLTPRGEFWYDLGVEVKETLEAAHPNAGVILVQDDTIDGDWMVESFLGGRWVRWATPLAEDVAAGEMLGADVLLILVEQDFGFSDYHANDQDFDSFEVAARLAQYDADYDALQAAQPLFRRHATWLYQDTGAMDAASEVGYYSAVSGGPGGFTDDATFQDYCAWWRASFKDDIMAGTGTWAGRALTDLGWVDKGEVDYTTATAAEFVAAIREHFGLEE